MNHTDSLGAKQLFTPLRFRCQQVFFIFAKAFFAAPSGQLVGARETYVSFSNPRQELFCHPGKFLFPSPFRTWSARWRERLYAPFRSHRQAFFPQKILWIYSMLTDYSINIPKRHIKMFAFFSSNILPPKNPATGNAGMGPSQCIHLPAFPRTSDTTPQNCRRSLPGSYLFQPIDGGELPMTALYLAFLLRRADLSFVRIRLPSSAIKKPGKVSPSRPVMADAPNPPRSGCCPRANSGHRPRHSSA